MGAQRGHCRTGGCIQVTSGQLPKEKVKSSLFLNLSYNYSPLFECCLAGCRAKRARCRQSQRPAFSVPDFWGFLATLSPRADCFPCKFLEMLLCLIIEFEKPVSSCRDCFLLAWLLTLYRLDRTCISENSFFFNHLYFTR